MAPAARPTADNGELIERRAQCAAHNERIAQIEEDLRPLTKLYNAVIGGGIVLTAMLSLLVWIYMQDRDALKSALDAVSRQQLTIEKLILKHEELERDVRRDIGRVEQGIERHRH